MFDIYAYVYAQLNATDKSLNEIVKGSGVAKTTVRWIKNGQTKSPGIQVLKKLATYFEKLERDKQ